LVPLISHTIEKEGREVARRDLTCVLAVLGALLALICLLVAGISLLVEPYIQTNYVKLAFKLIPLLVPYAFFICLVGAISSVLNSMKVFFLPALGALFLNATMILCLLFVAPAMNSNYLGMLEYLGCSVLVAGILQLGLSMFLLYRQKMIPKLSFAALKNFKVLLELWKLTLPGILGASAFQVSLLVDKSLAAWISEFAEPALKYSDRIIYLPIGVFAVSFGSVALANMSRSAANNDYEQMISSMIFSLRHLLFICIPIAIFIFFFRVEIIRLLFLRGKFDETALKETAFAMMFYAWGIPAFAAVKIVVSGFYARKDMRTPFRISLVCIAVNIVLNLILMWPLAQGGIALATVISSLLNNALLLFFLKKSLGNISFGGLSRTAGVGILASLASVLVSVHVYRWTEGVSIHRLLPENTFPFLTAGVLFVTLYALLSFIVRSREIPEMLRMFSRKK